MRCSNWSSSVAWLGRRWPDYTCTVPETHPRAGAKVLARQALSEIPGSAAAEVSTEELKASIVLFSSLLDEKQRRLYAGLESIKFGRGGDQKLAGLLQLDSHTVARGRQELLAQEVERERVRKPGGGRKPTEKKRPT